jgi:uncharacterized protein
MKTEDEFEQLRKTLQDELAWPSVYMFKFIVPANSDGKAAIESKFSDEAVITHSASSTGKYVSITIKEVMLTADAVIDKYKSLEGIEGVISL